MCARGCSEGVMCGEDARNQPQGTLILWKEMKNSRNHNMGKEADGIKPEKYLIAPT